jgi:hypothetical protein
VKKKLNRILISSLFVIGLGIVGLITAAIISTLRGPASGSVTVAASPDPTSSSHQPAIPPQEPTTVVPYPYPNPFEFLTSTAVAKQTAAGPLDTQYAIMLATYLATTPSSTPPKTPFPTGTVESDVYLHASGRKLGVVTQNAWVGLVDGNEVDVWAGASLDDPQQGIVRITVSVFRGGISELITTPTKNGGVRVVSEHNNRLTLVSTNGTVYYFDVPARRFIASRTEVVASATLPATGTPLPPPPTIGPPTLVPPTYNPYPTP